MEAPKFVFECQRTGRCCKVRKNIEVFLDDIERWWKDGTFMKVFPYIEVENKNAPTRIKIAKGEVCPLLEGNNCTIYNSRPISCVAYPLGFSGENFVVKDEGCTGIGKGKMTQEMLNEMREVAKTEHFARVKTIDLLPAINAVLMKEMVRQTEEALKKMSDEDKKKIEEIFKKR